MMRVATTVARLHLVVLTLAACGVDERVAPPPGDDALQQGDDGSPRLIYTANEASASPNGGARAMSVRQDGTGARPVFARTQPWAFVVSLSYSPDRERIVFHGGGDLHVARTDGTGIVRLESEADPMDQPRWSPDGRSVLATQFPHTGPSAPGTVWVFAADGSAAARLPVSTTGNAIWTPDGLINVQLDGGRGWASVTHNGTVVRQLTGSEQVAQRQAMEDTSPDGQWRAWVSPRSGLYLVRPDSTGQRLLYARAGLTYAVRWSPDGRHIAVLAGCGGRGLEPGELVVVSAENGSARTIARNVFCRGDFDW